MKVAAYSPTPKFGLEASKRILADVTKDISVERKKQLEHLSQLAKRAYQK